MRIAAVVVMVLVVVPARAETTVRYTVLFQGKTGGAQVTKIADDGTITVDYSYRNNGRGPDLKEEFQLANDGTLVAYSANGKSTMGAPIRDVFSLKNGKAQWKSLSRTLDRAGSITPGKLADLILVDGDPTEEISAIRRVNLVLKDGVAYYPSEIYQALGVKPFAGPVRGKIIKP